MQYLQFPSSMNQTQNYARKPLNKKEGNKVIDLT